MEILILHPGALGDIILSLPALALLRRRFTRARITVAGNLDFLAVAAHDYADALTSLSTVPLHRLYSHDALPEEDVRFWTGFDRVVSWTGFGDPQFTARLTGVSRCVRIASWKPVPQEARHVSRIFVDSLRGWLDERDALPLPDITPSHAARREAELWLAERGWRGRDLVALHPGAGNREKRWPAARFRQLLTRLAACGNRGVLVIEGPAEAGMSEGLIRGLPAGEAAAAAGLPLEVVAGLLQNCRSFVGNDSGIAHLAAGIGCSTLVLFGPTNPSHWAPLGSSVEVFHNATGCEPCQGASGRHSCMENITFDLVWQRLDSAGRRG